MKKLLTSLNKKQSFSFKVKSVDEKNYIVEGVFSAQNEDRHGDVVVQNGWILTNYLKNPVVLWAHQHDTFPIAKMVDISVDGINQLSGKMQFAVDEYEFAKTAFNLIKGGFLSAFSAGFMNNKYQIDQENNVVYLTENELLEVSVVPIPANELALAKTKGIDVGMFEEKAVDNDAEAIETLSKSNLETIRVAIGRLTEILKANTETDKKVGKEVEHPKANTETDKKVGKEVEHPVQAGGQKKVSVKLINSVVRDLLGVKKSI